MTMPLDFRTESLREPVASRDTAISCLVRLGAQNGVDLEIETVRRRADLDGDTITISRRSNSPMSAGSRWSGFGLIGKG